MADRSFPGAVSEYTPDIQLSPRNDAVTAFLAFDLLTVAISRPGLIGGQSRRPYHAAGQQLYITKMHPTCRVGE
jgi:hypothetical protein